MSLAGSSSALGWSESDSSAIAEREHDLVAAFVDDYLMMEPAQDDQVCLVGLSTSGPGRQMMDLETVLPGASVATTGLVVVVEQSPAQGRWCRPLFPAVVEIAAIGRSGDDLGVGVTENRLQRFPTHSRLGPEGASGSTAAVMACFASTNTVT